MRSVIERLTLHDFRSYEEATLVLEGRCAYLFGPNGAGKTNLLEAISLFSPGRGLRGASAAEFGRRNAGDSVTRDWAVAARISLGETRATIGSGADSARPGRRVVRIDGENAAPGALTDFVRPIWLTPAQDRLFLEAPAERRRFFDRLVFAGDPAQGAAAAAYDRALRERIRLLLEDAPDPTWLGVLEARMATAGSLAAGARARALGALQNEIDGRGDRPFPKARLTLTGEWERLAGAGTAAEEIAARLRAALAAGRARDAAAGRTLVGPHRGDLEVVHAEKQRPAADCSTGEQKALILNLVLSQAARLSRAISPPNPILLLDEVAAHLDAERRAALFDEIEALSLQAFLTGTDAALFEPLRGRAAGVRVTASQLTLTESR